MKKVKLNKKPARIIFLDDGVLATCRVQSSKLEGGTLEDYDPVIVEFLDSICIKYLCFVVITSKKGSCMMMLNGSNQKWFNLVGLH
jgi:hypothetical protein